MNLELVKLNEICVEIEQRWRQVDNNVALFPEIVMAVTDGADLSYFGDIANLLTILGEASVASLQTSTSFSDLHLNLWSNGQFLVEVLNWHHLDINIHDHNFSGVQFQLNGTSLNAIFDFSDTSLSSKLTHGTLSLRTCDLWQPGGRSMIRQGALDPHIVVHLEKPTVSLLIRTAPTSDFGTQRNYFAPSLRASYEVADDIFRKKRQALRLVDSLDGAKFHELFKTITARQTHTENLFMLTTHGKSLFHPDHRAVLSEFSLRGETEAEIVKSALFKAASDFILKEIKHTYTWRPDQILALGILGICFAQPNLERCLKELNQKGHPIDLVNATKEILQTLEPHHRKRMLAILEIFEYRDLVSELSGDRNV